MRIEFDPDKSALNTEERGLPFTSVHLLDWETARIVEDVRKPYPERRFIASAMLDGRLHIVCFTPIETGVRVISFRKANKREVRRYEQGATHE